jgi:AraC-like DNA-binding protein
VHDRFTAARCATELGFRDPGAFSVFFRTATGRRPGAWQAAQGQASRVMSTVTSSASAPPPV